MAKVGYVSLKEGHEGSDRQEEAIRPLVEELYIDDCCDRSLGRPEFSRMMAALKRGDVLYVESIGRLAKSAADLLLITDALMQKGVELVSFVDEIDTTSEAGKAAWKILAALSQLNKQAAGEWQKDFIEAAKKRSQKARRQGF